MDYKTFGQNLIDQSPKSRTIQGTLDGQVLWIKQAVPPKARIWHKLQKVAAWATRQAVFNVTVSDGGAKSLYAEAERLRDFKRRGFHVPDVLAVYDNMIVMTDAGQQLRAQLDKETSPEKRSTLLHAAMDAMSSLHQAGLAHGRPYMRDMTWNGEKIGFLDLEEDPAKVMPITTAQARDIWIFLGAASRYARSKEDKKVFDEELIARLYNAYAQGADPRTLKELHFFVEYLSPLRRFLDCPRFWDKIGSDARQAVIINRCLEKQFNIALN